ncbi:MAG: DUF6607 family protein [Pseudomonadota bacterium]
MNRKHLIWAAALALAVAPGAAAPAWAQAAPAKPAFEADRADILAMAGTFKVRFDMQESTRWRTDYTPLEPRVSGGNEVVRVIEDSGRHIALQHLLVVEIEGRSHVIKHWRQDWDYEPARVLVYSGPDEWTWQPVPEAARKGRWSQTVWQVDDSPRYGALGRWEPVGGLRRWTSDQTARPLARRDAIRGPVYDRYLGVNRHQPTPDGWIHWQDNLKLGMIDGALVPVVSEYVLNTYTRFDGYDVKAADDYWAATRDFWAVVRAEWERIAAAKGGIHVMEVAETGSAVSARLLEIADDLQAGKLTQAAAVAQARALMDSGTAKVAR